MSCEGDDAAYRTVNVITISQAASPAPLRWVGCTAQEPKSRVTSRPPATNWWEAVRLDQHRPNLHKAASDERMAKRVAGDARFRARLHAPDSQPSRPPAHPTDHPQM